jgi:hypothetical protein
MEVDRLAEKHNKFFVEEPSDGLFERMGKAQNRRNLRVNHLAPKRLTQEVMRNMTWDIQEIKI